jgi:hypothetical protein
MNPWPKILAILALAILFVGARVETSLQAEPMPPTCEATIVAGNGGSVLTEVGEPPAGLLFWGLRRLALLLLPFVATIPVLIPEIRAVVLPRHLPEAGLLEIPILRWSLVAGRHGRTPPPLSR